jgi:hypothetical protein
MRTTNRSHVREFVILLTTIRWEKEKEVKNDLLSYIAPAAGLEPATL